MSGDSPSARDLLADAIGLDCVEAGVEEILQGTFSTDNEGMDGVAAFSEMKSF